MNDGNFGQFRSDRLKHFSFIPVFNTQADEFGSNIQKKKRSINVFGICFAIKPSDGVRLKILISKLKINNILL